MKPGLSAMPEVSFVNLLAVALVAVTIPLLLGFAPGLRVPSVVFEIIAGVVLGPGGLGLVHPNLPVRVLAVVGLAFLLFLAGLEIDLRALRGRPLRLAAGGYVITLALGLAIGFGLSAVGWISAPVLLAAFAGLRVTAALALRRGEGSARLGDVLVRLQDSTAQIWVRAAVVALLAFVVLAGRFGLETILGAFVAGAVVGLVDRNSASHPHFPDQAGCRRLRVTFHLRSRSFHRYRGGVMGAAA